MLGLHVHVTHIWDLAYNYGKLLVDDQTPIVSSRCIITHKIHNEIYGKFDLLVELPKLGHKESLQNKRHLYSHLSIISLLSKFKVTKLDRVRGKIVIGI